MEKWWAYGIPMMGSTSRVHAVENIDSIFSAMPNIHNAIDLKYRVFHNYVASRSLVKLAQICEYPYILQTYLR
jgi:hypothetical protein